MGWLIAGLVGLIVLGGLIVIARRRGGHHRGADDTLVSELLGPRERAEVPAPQAEVAAPQAEVAAPQAPEEAEPSPVPQPAKEAESSPFPPPPPPAGPDAEGDWLESQLAWITTWSQRMHERIESAGQSGPDRTE